MTYRRRLFAVLFATIACGQATSARPSLPTEATVSLNSEFELAPGQSGVVTGQALTIRFDSVTADSRCPATVQCVWAGDGVARLTLLRGGATDRSVDLHTTLQPTVVTEGTLLIALLGLNPAARVEGIRRDEYRVRLVVRENR